MISVLVRWAESSRHIGKNCSVEKSRAKEGGHQRLMPMKVWALSRLCARTDKRDDFGTEDDWKGGRVCKNSQESISRNIKLEAAVASARGDELVRGIHFEGSIQTKND